MQILYKKEELPSRTEKRHVPYHWALLHLAFIKLYCCDFRYLKSSNKLKFHIPARSHTLPWQQDIKRRPDKTLARYTTLCDFYKLKSQNNIFEYEQRSSISTSSPQSVTCYISRYTPARLVSYEREPQTHTWCSAAVSPVPANISFKKKASSTCEHGMHCNTAWKREVLYKNTSSLPCLKAKAGAFNLAPATARIRKS